MTLATFHTEISAALRRGTSPNVLIPGWVEDAALWLEQNYTFGYMRRTENFTLDPEAEAPNLLEIEDRLKTIEFIRAVGRENANNYGYLTKIDAGQVASIDAGDPSYYWRDGPDYVYFDANVESELTLQIRGAWYTEWPADEDETPTLLRFYKNLLKAQTLIEAAIDLKDERMAAAYNVKFERALQAVLVAEEEEKRVDTSVVMRYAPSS